MRTPQRITNWLETHWVAPAYSGWLLGGLSLFFFAAATNTMAGWLYAISGVMMALIAISAVLPARSLRGIRVQRLPIPPVSAGEAIAVELHIENSSSRPKTLLQVRDLLPSTLGNPQQRSIEQILPQQADSWLYSLPTQRRGLHRWHTVELRTAAPLGLFWRRQQQTVKAVAIVYPTVLPLSQCPLLDDMGQRNNTQTQSSYNPLGATEGLTRTLRPYRWGDPSRLVHWRTSARFGELRVRELEVFTGGQEIVIALDSGALWADDRFEQAVTAAASLYFYAQRRQQPVSLWTAATGLLRGSQAVLETLAAVTCAESPRSPHLPDQSLLWLTQQPASLDALPVGSHWLLWEAIPTADQPQLPLPGSGLYVQPSLSLQTQLQAPLSR